MSLVTDLARYVDSEAECTRLRAMYAHLLAEHLELQNLLLVKEGELARLEFLLLNQVVQRQRAEVQLEQTITERIA